MAAPACWPSVATASPAICGTLNSCFLHVFTDFDDPVGNTSASFMDRFSTPSSSYHSLLCSGEQEGQLPQLPSPRQAVAHTNCMPMACHRSCRDSWCYRESFCVSVDPCSGRYVVMKPHLLSSC